MPPPARCSNHRCVYIDQCGEFEMLMEKISQQILKKDDTKLKDINIIQLFGHCVATWYAMSWSLVKLTEIGTSCGRS